MTDWSQHPPHAPCFALFRGARHIRHALFEHLCEPVEVREVYTARVKGLAVAQTGRATLWPIGNFAGEWQVIEGLE